MVELYKKKQCAKISTEKKNILHSKHPQQTHEIGNVSVKRSLFFTSFFCCFSPQCHKYKGLFVALHSYSFLFPPSKRVYFFMLIRPFFFSIYLVRRWCLQAIFVISFIVRAFGCVQISHVKIMRRLVREFII